MQALVAGFGITETVNSFEIDVKGERVRYRQIDAQQLHLNDVASQVSQQDLLRWLDDEVRQPDIGQLQMQAYLVRMLTHLLGDRGFSLTALVRAKFQLVQALQKEVDRLRKVAMTRGFQARLSEMAIPPDRAVTALQLPVPRRAVSRSRPLQGQLRLPQALLSADSRLARENRRGACLGGVPLCSSPRQPREGQALGSQHRATREVLLLAAHIH